MPRVLSIRRSGARTLDDIAARWPGAVYVGRAMRRAGYALPESKWANPFKIGRAGTRAEVIARYRAWIAQQPALRAALPELRGKDLVCWCAPEPCHAEVLLDLANR